MKPHFSAGRIARDLLSALAGALLALNAQAQVAPADAPIVAARAAELEARIPDTHPRLLITPADLPALRDFLNSELPAEDARLRRAVLPSAEPAALIPQPEAVKNGSPDSSKRWREGYAAANSAGVMAQRHAFAWLVARDPAQGREAARWLLHLASWQIDDDTYRSNDELFIQHLRPMIFAYDWAQDALDAGERARVRAALIARLEILAHRIQPKFSLQAPTPPDNSLSHPMRFISTLGQGGAALLHETPDAAGWLAWSYEYYLRQFPVWGGPAGGWAEGLNYWSTGITQHQRFLEGMALLGFDAPLARPFWRHTAYFGVYNLMAYPASSFGDLTNIMAPSGSIALILEKAALAGHDPYPAAFARSLGVKAPTNFGYYNYDALDALLTRFRSAQAKLPTVSLANLPQSRYFDDIGVVAMHSALGDARNDIMLGLRASPQGSASHSFADQNSFVLNAFGAPLAINSGYREFYGSAHHVGWTRQTRAKNALLFGGEGQRIRDASASGRITRFADGAHFSFASGDALAAYAPHATRALRHVFFVNRRYFVLLDEAAAHTAMPFQWMLHARSAMRLDPAQGEIEQQQDAARLTVRFLAPAPAQLAMQQTDAFDPPVQPGYSKRMPNEWHVTTSTRTPTREIEFLTLLYPSRAGESVPASHVLAASAGHALEIGDARVLFAREAEKRVRSAGAELDGMAASLSPEGGATRFALVDATRLATPDWQLETASALDGEGEAGAQAFTLNARLAAATTLWIRPGFRPRSVEGAGSWQQEADGRVRISVAAGALALKLLP